MAGIITNNAATTRPASTSPAANFQFALVALTSLFFMWGFITCLNDILIPHLKNVFQLNYTQSMLIQLCFFGAYFIVSLPAGALVKRISYKWGIVAGLRHLGHRLRALHSGGELPCLRPLPCALFVLATGITLLQVAANPYVTVLGPPDTAASRLTLTQAFNSLGTTLAPMFGAFLILSATTAAVAGATPEQLDALRLAEAGAVQLPT